MSERVCGNCRWWQYDRDWANKQVGQCRQSASALPEVYNTDFCGQWADKTITPEQEEWRERVLRVACAIMSNEHAANLTSERVWARAVHFAAMDPERPQGG